MTDQKQNVTFIAIKERIGVDLRDTSCPPRAAGGIGQGMQLPGLFEYQPNSF